MHLHKTAIGTIKATVQSHVLQADMSIIQSAIFGFGYLLARNEQCTFSEFAGRIERHYDASNPKTAATLESLRRANSLYRRAVRYDKRLRRGDALAADAWINQRTGEICYTEVGSEPTQSEAAQ